MAVQRNRIPNEVRSSLRRRANARNGSFLNLGGNSTFINSFDKTKNLCFDLSHRRSTTVSLETRNPKLESVL